MIGFRQVFFRRGIATFTRVATQEVLLMLKAHKTSKHELFSFLRMQAREGFNRQTMDTFRANLFTRAIPTIPSFAHLIKSAVLWGDYVTLAFAGKNLYEETGEGHAERSHLALLELSFNRHAMHVFGLPHLRLVDAPYAKETLFEFKRYFHEIGAAYEAATFPTQKGIMLAHETAAINMLSEFYESIFLPYRLRYTESEFAKVSQYFTAHLSGVEQRHAKDALQIAVVGCQSEKDLQEIEVGIKLFSEMHTALWDELVKALRQSELSSLPKIEFVTHSSTFVP